METLQIFFPLYPHFCSSLYLWKYFSPVYAIHLIIKMFFFIFFFSFFKFCGCYDIDIEVFIVRETGHLHKEHSTPLRSVSFSDVRKTFRSRFGGGRINDPTLLFTSFLKGIRSPPKIWQSQFHYSKCCVFMLLVIAIHFLRQNHSSTAGWIIHPSGLNF